MCVNKLRVKNNKIEFNSLTDRLYNYVPCGKCEECLKNRVQQYETRLVAEYESCKKNGGNSFFYTLTYDEQHVPRFYNHRVFSKYDVQKFLKRLRKELKTPFRYFLSSEYGHKTFRPHYHIDFFFNKYIDPKKLYESIKSCWYLGNIMPGRNLGLINSAIPMRYVAKYVDKDISSLREFNNKHFTREQLEEYKEEKHSRYFAIDLLPFHLQSSGLGLSLALHLNDDDLCNGYFISTDALGISRKVSIPLYIIRHTIYTSYVNKYGSISYKLNERGVKLFNRIVTTQYKREKCRFDDDISKFVHYYSVCPIFQHFFKTVEDLKEFVTRFVDSNWSDWLARYCVIYRGYNQVQFDFTDVNNDIEILKKIEMSPDDVTFLSIAQLEELGYPSTYIHSELDEALLKLFDCVYQYERYKRYVENVQSYNINQQFRSFKTGKNKSVPIKTLNEYINICSQNQFYKCLTKKS